MIFIDSNIPMYLTGAQHPNRARAEDAVNRCIDSGERLVTDAEVFQELLHRFGAIRRWEAIQPTFDLLTELVDEIFSIGPGDVERAKGLMLSSKRWSARDALHLATMARNGVGRILTFDTDFDRAPGVTRLQL